jgi:hypothetical protein
MNNCFYIAVFGPKSNASNSQIVCLETLKITQMSQGKQTRNSWITKINKNIRNKDTCCIELILVKSDLEIAVNGTHNQ